MVKLRKLRLEDVEEITALQKRTFDEDSITHSPDHRPDGPPGYDDPANVQERLYHMDCYAIVSDEKMIGGIFCSLSSTEELWVHRIFLIPEYQGKGLGKGVFKALEKIYSRALTMALDTPAWHSRNHGFYESIGFRKVGEEDSDKQDFHLFQYRKELK